MNRTRRILVVEDEAIIAADLRARLQAFGYDVVESVRSGEEALEAYADLRPDLVLMDIKLSGEMDGIEAALSLRKTWSAGIVFLTSYTDESTLKRAKLAQPLGFLVKPYEGAEIRSVLEIALHKHEADTYLANRERFFSTTLDSIGEAVIATDEKLGITFINRAAQRVTGWDFDEAIGRSLREVLVLTHEGGALIASPVASAIERGIPVQHECDAQLIARDGTTVTVGYNAAPIIDDSGMIAGGVVVVRDVSEERRSEARLALAERMAAIGTLAAGVAHEINNPLQYVLTNVVYSVERITTLSELDLGPNRAQFQTEIEQIREALEETRHGVERAGWIVSELRRFARRERTSAETLSIPQTLERALRYVEPELEAIHIERVFAPTPMALANPAQLGQVFQNILVNAAQAIRSQRPSGSIRVASGTDSRGQICVEITDDGPGMSNEVMARIFEPFFTTKPVGTGPGLGLAIAFTIVKELGGDLSAESQLGKGATFRITIPPAARHSDERAQPAGLKQRARILIIDDERAVASSIERTLKNNLDVVVEVSPQRALQLLREGANFDIVLCDLTMPELDGLAVLRAIHRINPDLTRRFVLMTGASSDDAIELVETYDAKLLEKPFSPQALQSMIAELLA